MVSEVLAGQDRYRHIPRMTPSLKVTAMLSEDQYHCVGSCCFDNEGAHMEVPRL